MQEILELMIYEYESSLAVKKYKLSREEFIYLYLMAEGCQHVDIMDYFDCQKDKLYRLRASIISKMKAKNFNQALVFYIRAMANETPKK